MFEGTFKVERKPWAEANKFVDSMRDYLEKLGIPRDKVIPGGSLRRGKPTVGDIDVVLVSPLVNKAFYQKFVDALNAGGHKTQVRVMGDSQMSVLVDDFLVEFKKASPEFLGAMMLFVTGCLHGKTKVALLDGRDVEIEQLVSEFNEGKDNWVYSVDGEGRILPNKIMKALKSVTNTRMVRVFLDNGESLLVTPDHRFILRDGVELPAIQLSAGQSLMPLYRRVSQDKRYQFNCRGYEEVYVPAFDLYEKTHRIVVDALGLRGGFICRHKDFNSRNNNPENLLMLSWDGHTRIHNSFLKSLWEQESFRIKQAKLRSERNSKLWASTCYREKQLARLRKVVSSDWFRKKSASHLARLWRDENFRRDNIKRMKRVWESEVRLAHSAEGRKASDECKKASQRNAIAANKALVSKMRGVGGSCNYCGIFFETFGQLIRHKGRCAAKVVVNHKVVKVVVEDGLYDGFDLVLFGVHNFGLSSGVFVHNSGDYNMGMRGYAKALGYSLNQYGLFKRDTNELIAAEKEEDIFRALGVPYVEPKDRNVWTHTVPRKPESDFQSAIPADVWLRVPDDVKVKLKGFVLPARDELGKMIPRDFLSNPQARHNYYKMGGKFRIPDEFKLDKYLRS